MTHRTVTKDNDKYYVNGSNLLFYHFSGFDSGVQLIMLDVYAKGNPALYELRDWYIDEITKNGQRESENKVCYYNLYSDGTYVTQEERDTLHQRLDIQRYFAEANPYMKGDDSYYSWFVMDKSTNRQAYQTKEEILNELNNVYASKSWKWTSVLRRIRNFAKRDVEA